MISTQKLGAHYLLVRALVSKGKLKTKITAVLEQNLA